MDRDKFMKETNIKVTKSDFDDFIRPLINYNKVILDEFVKVLDKKYINKRYYKEYYKILIELLIEKYGVVSSGLVSEILSDLLTEYCRCYEEKCRYKLDLEMNDILIIDETEEIKEVIEGQ